MGPKTRAEIQRAYRESNRDGVTKKPRKREGGFSERTEKGRSLRTKKLLKFLEKERNGKRKSYIPASLFMESEQAKRWKEGREKSMSFRERLRKNKENLQTPSTAGSVENADDDSSQPLVVKLDLNRGKKTTSRKRISRGSPAGRKKVGR